MKFFSMMVLKSPSSIQSSYKKLLEYAPSIIIISNNQSCAGPVFHMVSLCFIYILFIYHNMSIMIENIIIPIFIEGEFETKLEISPRSNTYQVKIVGLKPKKSISAMRD